MRQILFLDFDGVLNNTEFYNARARARAFSDLAAPYSPREDFDIENMAQLAEIIARLPDLDVVVSSTWRKGATLEKLRDYLSPAVPRARVVGNTGEHPSRERWREVRAWLDANRAHVGRWLALDDDTQDMRQLGTNFLHVDRKRGLTLEHVEAVLDHFTRP